MWVIYHAIKHRQLNASLKLNWKSTIPFFTKEHSVYYNDDKTPKWPTLRAPVMRSLWLSLCYALMAYTFMLAAESGINTGIITSLFCTSLLFTSLIFYFNHGQKLKLIDEFGMILVVGCVVLISFSKSKTVEIDLGFNHRKFGAIISSIACGIWFSVRSVEIHHSLTTTKLTAF